MCVGVRGWGGGMQGTMSEIDHPASPFQNLEIRETESKTFPTLATSQPLKVYSASYPLYVDNKISIMCEVKLLL